jgi:hypothetical protein
MDSSRARTGKMGSAMGALSARLQLLLALAPFGGAGDVMMYVRQATEISSVQELNDAVYLDDGTVVLVGATDDPGWLAGVPNNTLTVDSSVSGIDNSADSLNRVGFILALNSSAGAGLAPIHVTLFEAGAVAGVSRIRTSSGPGVSSMALFISGQVSSASVGSAYFIAKLNRNFVRGHPTAILWQRTIRAGGQLAVRQPWDVAADGNVTLVATAVGGGNSWSEVWSLDPGGHNRVVSQWREHYLAGGASVHHASPAPSLAVRSVVVLDSSGPHCGLRSWSTSDFLSYDSDLGLGQQGAARRGSWPWDLLFNQRCDTASPSSMTNSGDGYTGASWSGGMAVATSLVIDRSSGDIYLGMHATASPGAMPAVVSWSSTGELRWWSRLMAQNSLASNSEYAVPSLAIDTSGQRLMLLATTRGPTDIARSFWSPGITAFQSVLGGLGGTAITSTWIGGLSLANGTLQAATHLAELSLSLGSSGDEGLVGYADGTMLSGFPNLNQLPPSVVGLGDTACVDIRCDELGQVYVACSAGAHTATTRGAFHQNVNVSGLGADSGSSVANHFVRVYNPSLSAVQYSSLIGGSAVAAHAVLPVSGGLLVAAVHADSAGSPVLTSGASVSWGGAFPSASGSSGVLGRFADGSLPGWPVATPSDCPAGHKTYLNGTDAVLFVCVACGIGRFADTINTPACSSCPAGRYSGALGATSVSFCAECPPGTETPEAATSTDECLQCAAGKFSSVLSGFVCEFCVAGRYATGEAATSCELCGVGRYSTVINATSPSVCVACHEGRYGPSTGGSSLQDSCLQCQAGRYAALTGTASCTSCPNGRASSSVGASAVATCANCSSGRVALPASSTCTACVAGKFAPVLQAVCLDCPAGTISLAAQHGAGSCALCTHGRYSAAGGSACAACTAGRTSQAGYGACHECGSAPSFAADDATGTIAFSSLRFGTFPEALHVNQEPSLWR